MIHAGASPRLCLLFFAAVAAACTNCLSEMFAIVKCAGDGTWSLALMSIEGRKQRFAFPPYFN